MAMVASNSEAVPKVVAMTWNSRCCQTVPSSISFGDSNEDHIWEVSELIE